MSSEVLILCLLSIFSTSVRSDYVAAVVEHAPLEDDTPNRTIETNLNDYRTYLDSARRNKVQIIVFPEYGLTGVVDDPTNYSVFIPDVGTESRNISEYVVKALSEAAIEHNMYIVFNIIEKATNAKNKTVYYNTNVAFDKTGKIVAKYRKINLYDEAPFTAGKIQDIEKAVFTTDFGRTFGTFICFDIAFYNPSRKILSLDGASPVTDIAFPTAWYSVMPFFHSLSFHQAYAAENQVNLLTANINFVKNGQGGSGIYGADGTVYSYYLSGKSSSKILISTVRTSPVLQTFLLPGLSGLGGFDTQTEELAKYNTPYYFKAADYRFKHLDFSKGNISDRICDGPFCCDFKINITEKSANSTTAIYQLMAYRGPIMLGPGVTGLTKMCFVIACESKNRNTCGTRNVNDTAIFSHLSVQAKVRNELEQYYVPLTLTTDLLPVFNSTYESKINDDVKREMVLSNNKIQNKVLLFGIYSNGVDRLTVSWVLSVFVVFNTIKRFL